MPLILTIRPAGRPDAPAPLRLDRRGAVIGRAPGLDWTLPDTRATISSRHCEIAFRDGAYLIADTSTNGTSVNGRRLTAPHRLNDSDVIGIGDYEVVASLTAETAAPAAVPVVPDAPADPLLRAAGVSRSDVQGSDAQILAAAGLLLREMGQGAGMLLGHRDRARQELGLPADAATAANPVRDASDSPGLARLLAATIAAAPSSAGAVPQAFAAVEAHQLATLKAMQAAMKETLDRLSPQAIRAREGGKGEPALWQAYERAFAAPDSGFADTFARAFRDAYQDLAERTPGR